MLFFTYLFADSSVLQITQLMDIDFFHLPMFNIMQHVSFKFTVIYSIKDSLVFFNFLN